MAYIFADPHLGGGGESELCLIIALYVFTLDYDIVISLIYLNYEWVPKVKK